MIFPILQPKTSGISQLTCFHYGGGYERVIKDNGCIALFAQTPFDKILGASNLPLLKYEWIWEKPMATGRLNCNFAPMKAHENILIFSKSAACYVKDKSKKYKYPN